MVLYFASTAITATPEVTHTTPRYHYCNSNTITMTLNDTATAILLQDMFDFLVDAATTTTTATTTTSTSCSGPCCGH